MPHKTKILGPPGHLLPPTRKRALSTPRNHPQTNEHNPPPKTANKKMVNQFTTIYQSSAGIERNRSGNTKVYTERGECRHTITRGCGGEKGGNETVGEGEGGGHTDWKL